MKFYGFNLLTSKMGLGISANRDKLIINSLIGAEGLTIKVLCRVLKTKGVKKLSRITKFYGITKFI